MHNGPAQTTHKYYSSSDRKLNTSQAVISRAFSAAGELVGPIGTKPLGEASYPSNPGRSSKKKSKRKGKHPNELHVVETERIAYLSLVRF